MTRDQKIEHITCAIELAWDEKMPDDKCAELIVRAAARAGIPKSRLKKALSGR